MKQPEVDAAPDQRRCLVVDDEPIMVELISRLLRREGLEILSAGNGPEGLALLANNLVDVMLLDYNMPGMNGLEVLKQAKRTAPGVVVVFMTGQGTVKTAVEAMKRGAFEFLQKPFEDNALLALTVRRALEYRLLQERNRRLEGMVSGEVNFPDLIGTSAAMQRILRLAPRMSEIDSAILIEGESGTGKEVLARVIHFNGPRKLKPFVPVDCGAIPEGIIESELFGHVKGSFTGAASDAPGLIAQSDGGTLFLDEIGELPLNMQTRLLRFLQQKEVRPVGGTKAAPVDARVMAATNRDLKQMVKDKTFREDLYYRLNVVNLKLPPLRERKDDIPALLRFFLDKHGLRMKTKVSLSPEAFQYLLRYSWPGNIRELENIVLQILSLYPEETIRPESLPPSVTGEEPSMAAVAGLELPLSLRAYEVLAVKKALACCRGDVDAAARVLEVGKSTLYRKIGEMEIDLNVFKGDGGDTQ